MKKFLAILLALVMVLSLVACGGGSNDDKNTTDDNTTGDNVNNDADNSNNAADSTGGALGEQDGEIDNSSNGEIGLFNPDYDYSANPRYKVAYYVLATGVLYEATADALEHWCSVMNLEWGGMIDCGGDKDLYLSQLVTLSNEYDGLILDPDAEMYTRCAEILADTDCAWMGNMSSARDYTQEGAPLLHPFVGFDNYEVGTIMLPQLLHHKEQYFPDVDLSEVGFMCVDFSVSPPLHQREQGFYDTLIAYDATIADRYWVADCSIGMFDVDTSNTVVSSKLAEHPEYEYWLIYAEIDDMAQGAAAALDTAGLTDNAAVVTFGGTGLQLQWDSGMQDAWRSACYLPQTIYSEPIIGALYAFMNGDATPETIWPEWIPAYEVVPYAARLLPSFWIEYDNYQKVLEWSDVYCQSDIFKYDATGITRNDYSTTVKVPESYASTTNPAA